ncbi:hypothetical protein NDU88_001752 [Pleurodeles waltl]|uniref:Uncharacterized protein n=1 Tax=Pleurodeles waltl TaxID=8319 RepID=A0AAV7UTL7_PLEWA|nr:hypothetical protein NDU88_001752 [Pleurodeles waltl]
MSAASSSQACNTGPQRQACPMEMCTHHFTVLCSSSASLACWPLPLLRCGEAQARSPIFASHQTPGRSLTFLGVIRQSLTLAQYAGSLHNHKPLLQSQP